LTEHKAFLFDKLKELLVIPVSIVRTISDYEGLLWQGVYVFNINLSDGLVLKGNVTHVYEVKRALYIDDVLYTVSNVRVKLNSLEDLELIKKLNFINPLYFSDTLFSFVLVPCELLRLFLQTVYLYYSQFPKPYYARLLLKFP
jgi:hypothetical protein